MNRYRPPKGVCLIPLAARIRGSRRQRNKHRFTAAERRRAGKATAGKTTHFAYHSFHVANETYNPDCRLCCEG
jgi:hypothetical protein